MSQLGTTELMIVLIVGPLCVWGYFDGKKKQAERKAAHEAERERLFGKVREFPELAKEIYQTIEDGEARYRGERKKVVKQVIDQGEPANANPPETPLQLFKAAFKSIFN